MSEDIFISYSRKNKTCVERAYHRLVEADYAVWMDRDSIRAAENFVDKIEEGLNHCRVFVLFWSVAAADSNWVKKELQIAYQKSLPDDTSDFVVVKLDDTRPPDPRPTHRFTPQL